MKTWTLVLVCLPFILKHMKTYILKINKVISIGSWIYIYHSNHLYALFECFLDVSRKLDKIHHNNHLYALFE